jgi:hypothetical protein
MSPEQVRKKQYAYDCAMADKQEPVVLGLKERNMAMDANQNKSMPKIEVRTK